jgi:hypothetical protein
VALLLCVIGLAACESPSPVARTGDAGGKADPPCLPTTWRRCVLDVLRAGGIAGLRFGASPSSVQAAIDSLLRQPGATYGRGGSCGLDHRITWWDDWTADGEPALTVYFRRAAFAGYQVGELGRPRNPPGGWALATARGLRVGDTLKRGRRLYGREFAISTAQGGSWSVRVRGGLIRGYASGVPGHGEQVEVATIDGGDVGCPALSP